MLAYRRHPPRCRVCDSSASSASIRPLSLAEMLSGRPGPLAGL